jgi:hypothetical protein
MCFNFSAACKAKEKFGAAARQDQFLIGKA